MTINCLRALYGFPAGKFSSPGNELGIPEWTENLSFADLDEFFAKYSSPRIPTGTVPEIAQVNEDKTGNGNGDTEPSLFEAEMDVQTAYSIIWPQQIRVYQVHFPESVGAIGPFNVFLDALVSSTPRFAPLVADLARTVCTVHISVPMKLGSCSAVERHSVTSFPSLLAKLKALALNHIRKDSVMSG